MRSGQPQQGNLRGQTTISNSAGRKAGLVAAAAMTMLVVFAALAPAADAATLGSVSAAASTANTWSNVAVTFKPTTSWPADGRIQVTFPPTYDVTEAAAAVGSSGCGGGYTRAIAGQVITIQRDGSGAACTLLTTLTIGNIHQPGAGSYSIGLSTQTATGVVQDTGTAVHTVNSGLLGTPNVLADSLVGGATTTYTFSFKTTNGWPANGLFIATFPSGYTVAPTTATMSGCGGQVSPSYNGLIVTLTRNGGSNCVDDQTATVSFNGVRNPSTVGVTPAIAFQTATANVRAIDTATDTVTIGSASLTGLSAIPTVNTAGATTTYTIGFTATNPIPSGGKVTFAFDAAFDLGSIGSSVAVTGCTGSAPTRTFTGQVVTLTFPTLTGTPPPNVCSAGPLTFAFTSIKSPQRSGSFNIEICTRNAAADASVACSSTSQPVNTIDNGRAIAAIVPAALTQTTLSVSDPEASKTGISYTFQFTLANDWPATGSFSATFPTGFTVSGASAGTASPACAALAALPNPATPSATQTVVLARSAAAPPCLAGTAISIQVNGLKNGPVSGTSPAISYRTLFPTSGAAIDQASGTVVLTPGTMAAQSVTTTPAPPTKVRDVVTYKFSFTTAGGWPADAQLKLVFPGSFDLSATQPNAVMTQGLCSAGNLPITRTGSILLIVRSGGTACPQGSPVTIAVEGVRNPMFSGIQTFLPGGIQTLSASGAIMDRTVVSFATPFIDPNTITTATVTPTATQAGATTSYTIAFTSVTGIPGDGKILVTFPVIPGPGFPQPLGSALTVTGQTGCTSGTFAAASSGSLVSPPVLTITRSGSDCAPGAVSFTVSGIRNPPVTGDYPFTGNWIKTTGPGGATQVIDQGGPAATVTLTPRPLTNTGILPTNSLQASGLTDYQFSFRTVNPMAAGDRITAVFPAAYTMPATPAATISGVCAGAGTVSLGTTTAGLPFITTTNPSACPGGSDVVVTFGGAGVPNKIRNPPFSGASGTIAFCTQLASATDHCDAAKTIDNASGSVTLTPGSFSAITVTPADATLGATTDYTFVFTAANPWPADGRLVMVAPAGVALESLSSSVGVNTLPGAGPSPTGCAASPGALSAARSGQTITLTRAGGVACAAGIYSVTVNGLRNPTVPGSQTFTWRTQLANGQPIDVTPTPVLGGQTVAFTPASLTDITVTPGSNVAGAVTTYAFTFTLVNPWPADGLAKVTFPTGYDLAGISTSATVTGCTGSYAVTKSGLTATVARSGGSVCAQGTAIMMTFTGVRNAAGSGDAPFTANALRTTTSASAGAANIDQGPATTLVVTLVPGSATGVSIAASNAGTSAASVYTIKLTLTNPWPADGKFRVTLPTGYTLGTPTATMSTSSGCTAGNLVNEGSAGNVVRLRRSGGSPTACPIGAQIEIVIGSGITNPSAAGSYFIDFATQGSGGVDIENAGATVPIGAVTAAIVQAQDSTPNALTRYTFVVATTATWPSDGRLALGFPDAFAAESRSVATTRTLGSTTMTSAALFIASDVGRGVLGTGIPAGTKIVSLTDASTAILSAAATSPSSSTVFLGPGVIQISGCNGSLGLDAVATPMPSGVSYVVELKRTGTGVVPCAPGSLTVTIDGIRNPSNRGRYPGFNVRLLSQANNVLEEHTGSVHLAANAASISSPTTSFAGITPGTNLTLQAIVLDSDGKPVGGFAVNWALTGAGQLLNPTSITDDSGIAVAVVQVASDEATVKATAQSLLGSPLTFSINPKGVAPGGKIVGSVTAIAPARVPAGTSFAAFADAFEAGGVRIGNVTHESTFRISPDGSCTGNVCTTTTSGPHTVTANYVGIEGTAAVAVDAGAPAKIAAVASPSANTAAGQGAVLTVLVTDAVGNPVPGITVTWAATSGGGSIAPTAITGPDGKATATLTTGETAGANTATATVSGLSGSPVTFTVTTPAPATLTAAAAAVTTTANTAVPVRVTLRDAAGKGIVGARITWSASGDGRVSAPQSVTDGNGEATMSVTSSKGGVTAVTATHAGLTATITVTVSDAAMIRIQVSPSSATAEVSQAVAFTVTGISNTGSSSDVTNQAVFSIAPDGVCVQNACTPASSGDHTVTVQLGALRATVPMTVAEGGSDTTQPSPAVPLPLLVATLAALVVIRRRRGA